MSIVLILALGLATYATRIGGHLILSRFRSLDPRVEAALDAVPAAVITALVTPAVLAAGIGDSLASLVVIVTALRLSVLPTLVIGAVAVSVLRAMGL
jgi:uncharacterized membrane protein